MGNIKSFRLSDRVENMFNSIKRHDCNEKTDTDIVITGIEIQFELEAQSLNPRYRINFSEFITDNRLIALFGDICDIMETLSFSDGYFLEDEVRRFMTVVEADRFFNAYDDDEYGKINFQQYRKAYQVIINRGIYKEKDFQDLAEKLQRYYEQKK